MAKPNEVRAMQEEFAKLMNDINWRSDESREVFAGRVLDLVKDRVDEQEFSDLVADTKVFPANEEPGFKYKKGLVAYVLHPGSYAPRSMITQRVVPLVPDLVAVHPEIELSRLKSGDFESVQEIVDAAKEELIGRRTGKIYSLLNASFTNGGANDTTWDQDDADSLKKAVDAGLRYVNARGRAKAIFGHTEAVGVIADFGKYSELTKEQIDKGVLAMYRGIPIVEAKNYVDSFNQARVGSDRFFIVGTGTVKVGWTQTLEEMDDVDVDTKTWHKKVVPTNGNVSEKNSVDCWKLLKTKLHNITRKSKCDGLKRLSIRGQSAATLL